MEPRFGHDFSQVRVYTDSQAAESSRAVQAWAYTVGSNIVFGSGWYAPTTNDGRQLMAHELAHVTQQQQHRVSRGLQSSGIAENETLEMEADAAARQAHGHEARTELSQPQSHVLVSQAAPTLPSLQRQSDDKTKSAQEKETNDEKKTVAELTTEIVAVLKPSLTALQFKQIWPEIEKQIKSPAAAKAKASGVQKHFPGLFADSLVKNLNALSAEERVVVSQGVYDQSIKNLTGLAASDFTKEFNSLDTFVRNGIEGGTRGYVATRSALINTFGSAGKINEYYKSMVQADFPSTSSKVKGHKTPVHPNLRERLQRGAELLKKNKVATKTWLEITEEGISSIGGFNIRENRNKTTALSFHSFGWAIDIDAELNPNVKPAQFPKALVEGLTGEDVYKGEAVKAIRSGGTAEELVPRARALRESSDLFKKNLESEASLKTATITYLKGLGLTITGAQSDALIDLLKAGTKKNKFNKKEIENWLSEAKAAADTKPAAGTAAAGAVAVTKSPWAEAVKIADLLIDVYRLFPGTTKAGQKIAASVTGTPQTIGARGFLSLPAELIAALTGSDGGGLTWLGGIEKGTKDFMHFELKKADQPELPKEGAKTSEGKPEATMEK
jgi:hypothetical protein